MNYKDELFILKTKINDCSEDLIKKRKEKEELETKYRDLYKKRSNLYVFRSVDIFKIFSMIVKEIEINEDYDIEFYSSKDLEEDYSKMIFALNKEIYLPSVDEYDNMAFYTLDENGEVRPCIDFESDFSEFLYLGRFIDDVINMRVSKNKTSISYEELLREANLFIVRELESRAKSYSDKASKMKLSLALNK